MRIKWLKLLTVCIAIPISADIYAQDKVEVELEADVVSNYIWRGQDLGSAAIQPTLGVSWKGLSLTGWGSYGLVDKDDTKEFDLTLAYSAGGFTVGITDYFCVNGEENCPTKYFLYDAHKTAHTFEANVGYDFEVLSLNWFTNFAGADGVNNSGKRAYSSYVQVDVPFKLGGLDWTASMGAVPYATDFYADAHHFAVTNVSVATRKELKITPTFTVPLFGCIVANPSTQKIYFTAGISF